MNGEIFIVRGIRGDYEPAEWSLDAWSSEKEAKIRCDEMQKNAMEFYNTIRLFREKEPFIGLESTDQEWAAWERHKKSRERLEKKLRKKFGDLEMNDDTRYYVEKVKFIK